MEVVLIQFSLQPPSLPAVRIAGGQVVLALARHFEADFLQGGDHVGAAPHRALLDALHQVVTDQFARVGFVFAPGPQLRCLDVGHVARLLLALASRRIPCSAERPVGLRRVRSRNALTRDLNSSCSVIMSER